MLTESDSIRLDIVIGSIRLVAQSAIAKMFKEREEDFSALLDQTLENYPWEETIKKAIDDEINNHVKAFVNNAMRGVRDWHKYDAIQDAAKELVRVRLLELLAEERSK